MLPWKNWKVILVGFALVRALVGLLPPTPGRTSVSATAKEESNQGLSSNLGLGSGSGSACWYSQQYALKMQVKGQAAYTARRA